MREELNLDAVYCDLIQLLLFILINPEMTLIIKLCGVSDVLNSQ